MNRYITRYEKFINAISSKGKRNLDYSEIHHIIPRCMGGTDDVKNLIELTLREHFIAHWMLFNAYPNPGLKCAFIRMCVQNTKHKSKRKYNYFIIPSRVFEKVKKEYYDTLVGKVSVTDISTGLQKWVTSKEYKENKSSYKFHTSGMVCAYDTILKDYIWVTSEYFDKNKVTDNTGYLLPKMAFHKFRYENTETHECLYLTKTEASTINKELGYKLLKQVIDIKVKTKTGEILRLADYNPTEHDHIIKGTVKVFDLVDNTNKSITLEEYNANKKRYNTSTKGKVLALVNGKSKLVDKVDFDTGNYVGQTKGLTTVLDKETNTYKQITRGEFTANKSKYAGPCTGRKNVIDKITGVRQQILSPDFDSSVHINLGDKRQYFKGRNKLTNKEKNISIYEWDRVKDLYDIIDQSQFIKATAFAKGK